MKVYIVLFGEKYDCIIENVYSTREKAETYCNSQKFSQGYYWIEEYEIDKDNE